MRKSSFASLLIVGVWSLTFSLGLSLSAQPTIVPRTDAQSQARTVWDVQRIGVALFSWLTDQVGRGRGGAAPGQGAGASMSVEVGDIPLISHGDLAALLVPQYIPSLPAQDGWGNPFEFRLNAANLLSPHLMSIRSAGRNGTFSGTSYNVERFDPALFDEDVVWADGREPHWPAIVLSGREAQRKTVADVQNVGTAMFSWYTDQVGRTLRAKTREVKTTMVNFDNYPVISHADLVNLLVPIYIQEVPELDGWGHPYDFRLNQVNLLGSEVMAIRSPGRDGSYSGDTYSAGAFDPNLFDEDIVWADGVSVRQPGPLSGLAYFTLTPCRVFDTRPLSALPSAVDSLFEITSTCGIPSSARALAVNLTIVGPTGAGYMTLFPSSLPLPGSSTLNFAAGQTRGNNAILTLTNERGIGSIVARPAINGNGHVDLLLDVVGFFE